MKYLLSITLFLCFFFASMGAQAMGAKRPNITPVSTPTIVKVPAVVPAPPPAPPVIRSTPLPTIHSNYSYLDPDHLVPKDLLAKALDYFDKNQAIIKNKNYLVVINFKQHNSKERFYIIDMQSGHVEKYLTAHGKNSDPDFDGYATLFSNTPNSEMSSLGFYLTAETYQGSHGLSLALDGLSPTNSNARSREIVIHGASYVTPGDKIGRSWGCPALDLRYYVEVINQIKNGVLIYADLSQE